MILMLVFGLVSFGIGAALGLRINLGILAAITPLALFVILGAAVLWWSLPYSGVILAAHSLASIAAGAWACRSIHRGRLRILICFSLGYVIGCLFGALGVVVGAVVGAISAKRSLGKPSTRRRD